MLERGRVYTIRKYREDRGEGIGEIRQGKKTDFKVLCPGVITKVALFTNENAEKYYRSSGFNSVEAWIKEADLQTRGNLEQACIYRVDMFTAENAKGIYDTCEPGAQKLIGKYFGEATT